LQCPQQLQDGGAIELVQSVGRIVCHEQIGAHSQCVGDVHPLCQRRRKFVRVRGEGVVRALDTGLTQHRQCSVIGEGFRQPESRPQRCGQLGSDRGGAVEGGEWIAGQIGYLRVPQAREGSLRQADEFGSVEQNRPGADDCRCRKCAGDALGDLEGAGIGVADEPDRFATGDGK